MSRLIAAIVLLTLTQVCVAHAQDAEPDIPHLVPGLTGDLIEAEALRQLTSGIGAGYPDWSPGGEWIVITSGFSDEQEGNLYLLPALGGEPVQIGHGGTHHGVFSPDGKLLALDAAFGAIVQVMAATGGTQVRIVPESVPVEHSANPAWSPDGSRIAFRSLADLCILDLASGEISQLYQRDGHLPMPIQWLADGVLVSLINTETKLANLWLVPLDGGEPHQVTDELRVTQGSVTADGRLLVYSAPDAEMEYNLWVQSMDGGTALQITQGYIQDVEPCWSPDGEQIVFRSTRADTIDLWVMTVDRDWIETELANL